MRVLSQHSPRAECQGAATMKARGATAGGDYIHEAHPPKMTQAWGTLTQSKPAARLRERAHHPYPYASNEARCSSLVTCESPAARLTECIFGAASANARLRRVSRSLVERPP